MSQKIPLNFEKCVVGLRGYTFFFLTDRQPEEHEGNITSRYQHTLLYVETSEICRGIRSSYILLKTEIDVVLTASQGLRLEHKQEKV